MCKKKFLSLESVCVGHSTATHNSFGCDYCVCAAQKRTPIFKVRTKCLITAIDHQAKVKRQQTISQLLFPRNFARAIRVISKNNN